MELDQIKTAILDLSAQDRNDLLSSITGDKKEKAPGLSDLLNEQERTTATVCPHCQSEHVIARGSHKSIRKFECKSCGKYFSASTNTALYRIHKKDKWAAYLQCMEDGLTIRAAAARVGISIQTSFSWRHRILERLGQLHAEQLEGITEVDEMFVMDSEKGNRNLDRPARKRAGKRIGQDAVSVLVGLDRKGHLIVKNAGKGMLKRKPLDKALSGKFAPGAVLCTDGLSALKGFAKRENLVHKKIIATDHQRLKDKAYHIQTVNGTHAQIRRNLAKFNGVATKYLQNYLNWFVAEKTLKNKLDKLAIWLSWTIIFYQIIDAT